MPVAFFLLGALLTGSPSVRAATARHLADVRPGAVIRTTQAYAAEIPPLLQPVLNSTVPLVIEDGRARPRFLAPVPQGPACLLETRVIRLADPATVRMPLGTEFRIRGVRVDPARRAPYVGPATVIEVEAAPADGSRLSGTFRCYPGPGAGAKRPITLEAFEQVFARHIRVDLEPGAPSAK